MTSNSHILCLASGSFIRQKLMKSAGMSFDVDPADIDERALAHDDPKELAALLARAKAAAISQRRPEQWIVGSDQVFSLDGKQLPKPNTRAEVEEKLSLMSGREHEFQCGLCVMKGGVVVAELVAEARVQFYTLSPSEIKAYAATDEGIGCAGAYRLEEGGVRLIQGIEGSHHTVLGLPLIPLIGILRREELVAKVFA